MYIIQCSQIQDKIHREPRRKEKFNALCLYQMRSFIFTVCTEYAHYRDIAFKNSALVGLV